MHDINHELLIRYLDYKATPGEVTEVESWMRECNLDRSMLQKLLHPTESVKYMMAMDSEKDLAELKQRISGRRIVFRPWLKIAASLVFALLIGIAANKFLSSPDSLTWTTIQNTTSGDKKLEMEDGSSVYLNAGASISYADNFNEQRTVKLSGEAFFNVKRDEQSPFRVMVQECEVKVLGTSFLVNADSASVEVIVKTGKVQLMSPENQIVILEKEERGSYNRATVKLSESIYNDPNRFSWQTHILVFENTPFEKVVHDLEKFFKVEIDVTGNPSSVPAYTSVFRSAELNDVLEEMKTILPLDYDATKGKVRIRVF